LAFIFALLVFKPVNAGFKMLMKLTLCKREGWRERERETEKVRVRERDSGCVWEKVRARDFVCLWPYLPDELFIRNNIKRSRKDKKRKKKAKEIWHERMSMANASLNFQSIPCVIKNNFF
jgi:hypothetical protein